MWESVMLVYWVKLVVAYEEKVATSDSSWKCIGVAQCVRRNADKHMAVCSLFPI
jgi:hypothetical protein